MCLSSSSTSGLIRPCVSPASWSVSSPSFVLATTSEQSGHKNDKDNADWPSWPTEGAEVGPAGRRWTRRRGRAIPKVDRDRTHRRPVCTHSGDFIGSADQLGAFKFTAVSEVHVLCYESENHWRWLRCEGCVADDKETHFLACSGITHLFAHGADRACQVLPVANVIG